jgi:nucleotide-binding universal stress UspA family protein
MNKILIAVDDTKGSQSSAATFEQLFSCYTPEEVIVLYVERYAGHSFMDDMITDSEISMLKDVLTGTEYKESLDKKANKIVETYKKSLVDKGVKGIKTIIRSGHPAEEILKVANEENAEMIIIGSRGDRSHSFVLGSVSREVVNSAEVPVLVAKTK